MQRDLANAHQRNRDLSNQLHQQGQALLRIPMLEEALSAERATNADLRALVEEVTRLRGVPAAPPPAAADDKPVAMIIFCPAGHRHIDRGRFATHPHKDHQCEHPDCGITWRVAKIATVGVERLYPIEPSEVTT